MLNQLFTCLTFSVFLAFTGTCASSPSQTPFARSITSSKTCRSDDDCGQNRTCIISESVPPKCVQRPTIDESCSRDQKCTVGLFCRPVTAEDTFNNSTCQTKGLKGGICTSATIDNCKSPFRCNFRSNRCETAPSGHGERCQNENECKSGLYCRFSEGLCSKPRPLGSSCASSEDCADGFCAGLALNRDVVFSKGICTPYAKMKGPCHFFGACRVNFISQDPVRCNSPRGDFGLCMKVSTLEHRLGAPCKPRIDRCDESRGLMCAWAPSLHRYACQHRYRRFQFSAANFCEPGSSLSQCPAAAVDRPSGEVRSSSFFKTVCRAPQTVGADDAGPEKYFSFFQCLRKLEPVLPGGICDEEYAHCTEGTKCRFVNGVRSSSDIFPNEKLAYCVRIVSVGQSCRDKFRFQCAPGLRCDRNTCVNGTSIQRSPFTHAGIQWPCDKLPCAPGLVCRRGIKIRGSRCWKPVKMLSRGSQCGPAATVIRKCKRGLVCALGINAGGVLRCRRPRRAREYCEVSSWCRKGLKCPV